MYYRCLLVLFEYVLLGIKKICELLVDLKVVGCKCGGVDQSQCKRLEKF